MSDFDSTRAREALEDLRDEFMAESKRYPKLRHFLVEAPKHRDPDSPGEAPRSSVISESSHDVITVPVEGEILQTHYYLGMVDKQDRSDLIAFRKLGSRVARILDGWQSPSARLFLMPLKFEEFNAAEAWMSIVHRLAWENIPSQELKATPSIPADSQIDFIFTEANPNAVLSSIQKYWTAVDILYDCRISYLPDKSVFLCSAWAIKLLIEIMSEVGPSKLIKANPREIFLVGLLEKFAKVDREYHSSNSDALTAIGKNQLNEIYFDVLEKTILCINDIQKWPHRSDLDWLGEVSESALEFSKSLHRMAAMDTLDGVGFPWDSEVYPISTFRDARRKLIGLPPVMEEYSTEPEISLSVLPDPVEAKIHSIESESTNKNPPQWNEKYRILIYNNKTKKYRKDAINIIPVLNEFEQAHWSAEIRSPFGDDAATLKDTITSLNDSLAKLDLKFKGNNLGVKWFRSGSEVEVTEARGSGGEIELP